MLSRFKSRRLVGLTLLAGLTNAVAPLAAQGPARGATGARTPTLISDCDYYESGCGGDPTYDGGGSTSSGGSGSTTSGGCGTGSRVFCREDFSWKCVKWIPQSTGASAGPTGVGGTTTMVCSESVQTTIKLYWP
jgi:hypothetical protein